MSWGAGRVCVIQLNRPKALNALCDQLLSELQAALDAAAADVGCGCVIITGNGRAFAAGADITELRPRTLAGIIADEFPGPCAAKPSAAPRPTPVLRARGPAGSGALLSGWSVGWQGVVGGGQVQAADRGGGERPGAGRRLRACDDVRHRPRL